MLSSLFKFLRSVFAIIAPIVILLMHFVVMLAFINRWDSVVAITLIPIWMWASAGMVLSLIAWGLLKSRLSLLTFFIWFITGLICADETPGVLREFRSAITGTTTVLPGANPQENKSPKEFRILTFNAQEGSADAILELLPLKPDIVLLQEKPDEQALGRLSRELFDNGGSIVSQGGSAILTSGEVDIFSQQKDSRHLGVTIDFPNGPTIDLLNLHLERSAPRYSVWRPQTWRDMTRLRVENRTDLRQMLRKLPDRVVEQPTIVAGDFGTPPGDDIFRSLMPEYQDAFREIGEGWGNTWPNQGAIVRIDQIWANPRLEPIRAFTVRSQHSDHRILVVDYHLVAPNGTLAAFP